MSKIINVDELLKAEPFHRIDGGSKYSEGYSKCAKNVREAALAGSPQYINADSLLRAAPFYATLQGGFEGEGYRDCAQHIRAVIKEMTKETATQNTKAAPAVPAASIGKRIREARKAAGLSQTALYQRCGIDITRISLYECGKKTPRGPTIRAIAEALGVSPGWLLKGTMEL